MNENKEIIDYICPKCGNTKSEKKVSENGEWGYCTKCGGITFNNKFIICQNCGCEKSKKVFTPTLIKGECLECGTITFSEPNPFAKKRLEVRCPYCNSTNTKKISEMSKAASVAVFGMFAMGKVSKQWHCNNCKSDF